MEVTVIVESSISRNVDYAVVPHTILVASCRPTIIAAPNSPHPVSFLSCVVVTIEKGVNVTMLPECLSKFRRILKLL
jgi:hypothetical protein